MLLSAAVLAGIGGLVLWLRPYWLAKYHGVGVSLRGANLPFAPLEGAPLFRASRRPPLVDANLARACLAHADLAGANLAGADLTGADLTGARLRDEIIYGTHCGPARYDARTRWPAGFDPEEHGASRTAGLPIDRSR